VPIDIGPDFIWKGPEDDIQLQSWLVPEPDLLDVGFLKRAIDRSTSVCLVRVTSINKTGTGVLIDRDLILTNYHVLAPDDDHNLVDRANSTELLFGLFTGEESSEPRPLRLASRDPVLVASPINELDFVLLRADVGILDLRAISPAPFATYLPTLKSSLNILQHPEGQEMKLALSSNGVASVQDGIGRIQYLTRAAPGSSGSPCFDDDWQLVALHHAERSRSFGSIREGILMRAIYERVRQHLKVKPVSGN
jgi:endonuclease G, mitochondrial